MALTEDALPFLGHTQQNAIEKILEERHREMPFIMRWFDIRRLAYNETDFDDVTVERDFYEVSDNSVNDGVFAHYVFI